VLQQQEQQQQHLMSFAQKLANMLHAGCTLVAPTLVWDQPRSIHYQSA
jgi:hypothetical protein